MLPEFLLHPLPWALRMGGMGHGSGLQVKVLGASTVAVHFIADSDGV